MKKKIGILFISSVFLAACSNNASEQKISTDVIQNTASASEENGSEALPEFEFVEEAYDFGEVSQGEKVTKVFTFRNIGNADLLIADAKGSCGCTVPEFPKEPIAPGEEGIIKVVFDSNGKKGVVHNTVTLIANTVPNTKVLAIKGNVLTPNNK